MNAFNPTRFMKLLKWRIHFGGKFPLGYLFGIFVPPIVSAFIGLYSAPIYMDYMPSVDAYQIYISNTSTYMLLMILPLAPSFLMPRMKRKSDRINELMLPASNMERYLSSYLVAVGTTIVVICSAWELTNLVQYAASALWFHDAQWMYLKIPTMLSGPNSLLLLVLLHAFMMMLSNFRAVTTFFTVATLFLALMVVPHCLRHISAHTWVCLLGIITCFAGAYIGYCRKKLVSRNPFSL